MNANPQFYPKQQFVPQQPYGYQMYGNPMMNSNMSSFYNSFGFGPY